MAFCQTIIGNAEIKQEWNERMQFSCIARGKKMSNERIFSYSCEIGFSPDMICE
jgi:hypothetical protein